MREASSLGQASGSRGIDQHSNLIGSGATTQVFGGICIRHARDIKGCRKVELLWPTIGVDRVSHLLNLLQRIGDLRGELRVHDQHCGGGGLEGVCQWFAGEVSVDEGSGGTNLVDAQPAEEELGLVLHKERDNVAALDALCQQPVADLVGRYFSLKSL